MTKIRVLIADDSPTYRAILRGLLEGAGDYEVVGEAGDGEQAVAMAASLRPTLVTMDLEMPRGGGIEAIERIMTTRAVPILVVTSAGESAAACEAIARGALDVVAKPQAGRPGDFLAKAKLLAGVPVITRYDRASRAPARPATEATPPAGAQWVFVIAASTGGPQALAQVLAHLPAEFPAPILIAQHISHGFAQGMASWLDSLCHIQVRLAVAGEVPVAGTAYVSPSEASLSLDPQGRIRLIPGAPEDLYHPSCDKLLASVAASAGRQAVGIILTGMGHDGVEGMARIRAAGGVTIGQDEASSIIYGMNRLAIEAGHVATVLPLARIAERMATLAGASRPGAPA